MKQSVVVLIVLVCLWSLLSDEEITEEGEEEACNEVNPKRHSCFITHAFNGDK